MRVSVARYLVGAVVVEVEVNYVSVTRDEVSVVDLGLKECRLVCGDKWFDGMDFKELLIVSAAEVLREAKDELIEEAGCVIRFGFLKSPLPDSCAEADGVRALDPPKGSRCSIGSLIE